MLRKTTDSTQVRARKFWFCFVISIKYKQNITCGASNPIIKVFFFLFEPQHNQTAIINCYYK